jgi:hypothetical protein
MFLVKTIDGRGGRPLESIVIANSETIFIGGTVNIIEGGVAAADAQTDRVYGICKGITVGNVPIQNANSSEYDGTWTAPTTAHQGTYAAAADNQTDKKIKCLIEPLVPGDTVRGDLDAAKGTTTGSDVIGSYIDILTSNEAFFDESSVAATASQFIIVGQVPGNGRTVDAKLVEGQLVQ